MRDEWYVARRGQEGAKRYGPVPLHELRGLLNSGRVQGEDLVWREGMGNWQRADQCADLGGPRPAAPPPSSRPAPSGRPDGYGYNPAPAAYGAYNPNPYPPPYRQPSSSAWVIPLVIVLGVLLVGGFGGVLWLTAVNRASSAASTYTTPTYYQPTPPVWNPPVVPDPGFAPAPDPVFVPPADPVFVPPADPPVVDPNSPDPVPPPEDKPDPP